MPVHHAMSCRNWCWQQTKDLLEVRYLEEVAAKEEKKKKFEEHEARMRLQIRKVRGCTP